MKIKVTENAKYNGQDMSWTEELEISSSDVDITVFHCSDNYIDGFLAKETCFFNDKPLFKGHTYKYVVEAGVEFLTDGTEIRVDLNNGDELEYIGNYKIVGTGEYKETYCNYEGWKKEEIMRSERCD